MGGVDLLDNMVAVYRIPFRKKKWWFSLYTWSLSVYAVNGWRLRMKHTGKKEPFLDYDRELVICMKAVNMCSKCKVPLHVGCFQEKVNEARILNIFILILA